MAKRSEIVGFRLEKQQQRQLQQQQTDPLRQEASQKGAIPKAFVRANPRANPGRAFRDDQRRLGDTQLVEFSTI